MIRTRIAQEMARRPFMLAAVLAALVLIFPLGLPVQAGVACALAAMMLLSDIPTALGIYAFMFLMDEVTVTSFLGGSAARAMQVALLARFAVWALKSCAPRACRRLSACGARTSR